MGRTLKPTTEMTIALNSAPRLRICRTESGQVTELILDEAADLDSFRAGFLAAFGTTELIIAEALFEQILYALHTDRKSRSTTQPQTSSWHCCTGSIRGTSWRRCSHARWSSRTWPPWTRAGGRFTSSNPLAAASRT